MLHGCAPSGDITNSLSVRNDGDPVVIQLSSTRIVFLEVGPGVTVIDENRDGPDEDATPVTLTVLSPRCEWITQDYFLMNGHVTISIDGQGMLAEDPGRPSQAPPPTVPRAQPTSLCAGTR